MNPLLIGFAAVLFFLLRKKTPVVVDNTTPAVVPFTAANVNAYKNENTKSLFDRRLAASARAVTPDGTGKNIVDGTYKCFAPGNQSRRNAIIKVYQDLDRLRTRIANTNDSDRKREARQNLIEKDNERAILVAEHYMICEAFFEELKARQAAQAAASAAAAAAAGRDPNIITTAPAAQQQRGVM